MEFTHKKLPQSAAINLRRCSIASVKPYAFMQAPVYVYMRRNQKFISVKAPLDFFVPEELEKLRLFEDFFVSESIDAVLPFKDAAKSVRALLSWVPRTQSGSDGSYPQVSLPISPYELSDAILRIVGPLWGGSLKIEPFFATVFTNELCDLLPGDLLCEARESNMELFERAVFRSGLAVFFALHLGTCNLDYLNSLRLRAFQEAADGVESTKWECTSDEILSIASLVVSEGVQTVFEGGFFNERTERACHKLSSRLKRVEKEFITPDKVTPTILGPKGFLNV